VTGTVECIPLICASILSKKLASGIDALVLDVKFGRGAFMKDLARARELAVAITTVANSMGTPTKAVLTAMEEPLGHAVGNALEVAESIAFLKGPGEHDMSEVTYAIGEQMLILTGAAKDAKEARSKLEATITSGAALAKFREMVAAQGGDVRVVDDPSLLPQAKLRLPFVAKTSGSSRTWTPWAWHSPRCGSGPAARRPRIPSTMRSASTPRQGGRQGEGRRRPLRRPRQQRDLRQGGLGDTGARDRDRGQGACAPHPHRRDRGLGDYFSSSARSAAAFSQAVVAAVSSSTTTLSSRFRCWALPGWL
jgi:hypothetical protein